jgi:hypothetical protein
MAIEVLDSPKKLVIQFKKVVENGVTKDVVITKVKVKPDDHTEEQEIAPQFGVPPGNLYPLGQFLKYKENPICVGFVMGGSYYEICF